MANPTKIINVLKLLPLILIILKVLIASNKLWLITYSNKTVSNPHLPIQLQQYIMEIIIAILIPF